MNIQGVSRGSDLNVQPIMLLDLPVKVRSWEMTVYPRSHIRRWFGVTRPAQARIVNVLERNGENPRREIGVIASGKLEKGGRVSNSETFHATLRVNESRPAELGQRPEASFALRRGDPPCEA